MSKQIEWEFPEKLEFVVSEGKDIERTIELPAGGTLVFKRPPGWEERMSARIRLVRPGKDYPSIGTAVPIDPDGTHREGIPPGLYEIGYDTSTKMPNTRHTWKIDAVWFRTIKLAAGQREVIVMPRPR